MTTREDALNVVSSTPKLLDVLLRRLNEETASQPVDRGWSLKDVLAHLILTERLGWTGRIRLIVDQEHPLLPLRDEDEELRISGLGSKGASELLQEFASERNDSVSWFRSLKSGDFARKGTHSEVGEVTAEEFLYHGAYHDLLHLGQVLAMVQSFYEPLRGPMRAY